MQIKEKDGRVKYIRALERFVKSAVALLKRDDFDAELFAKRMAKNYEILSKAQAVNLDSPYTKALENFAKNIMSASEQNRIDRGALTHEANALEKLKNDKNYKTYDQTLISCRADNKLAEGCYHLSVKFFSIC